MVSPLVVSSIPRNTPLKILILQCLTTGLRCIGIQILPSKTARQNFLFSLPMISAITGLLYGTDMGMKKSMYKITFRILETEVEHFYNPDYGYHWTLNGLALDTITLRKIYRENALKIL